MRSRRSVSSSGTTQLQYQQSALSKTSRIEQLANDSLKMQPITTGRTQYLTLPPGAAKAIDAPIPASADTAGKGKEARDEAVHKRQNVKFSSGCVLGVHLPMWRSKLVVFLLFMAFVARWRARVLDQGRQRVLSEAGRKPLPAHDRSAGDARQDSRP